MTEQEQYQAIKSRVDFLMSGGPFGDGIGPRNTSFKINEEFNTNYQPVEIWRIWRQGKEWADPKDDIYE